MRRERLEIGWYAVRPFFVYIVLFITVRSILLRLLESVLIAMSADMTVYYSFWHDAADLLILGIASAGAAIPLIKEGQREIMITRARSVGAWIRHRKDRRLLMGLLPAGTISLSAFFNLLLAGQGAAGTVSPDPYILPFAAAVYDFLTPFVEELVYRGIVWHRLRRGFSPLEAAFWSSLVFGAAHANLRQGLYAFVMGMVFAMSFELTRRFEVPYLLHCSCNLAVLAASAAGWGEVLAHPMWILFFGVLAAAVFGYWGKRLQETNYRL
jgi:membrane protease YdiL (CAAX protease family)